MLPTEPPLSLHRLVAPVPPARAQETATATRQVPAPAPVPVSNATVAQAVRHPAPMGPMVLAGHDQMGNAAVAKAALHMAPTASPPLVIVAPKDKSARAL
ncbi:hypothetical protein [Streptomyces sp. ME19-01-6]|uniref:hypothetical protein n=1 Tax=Streptomyces sp. ME19-01-6 TaxID=3028686 RepID=UPI0029BB758A|nr:hypothetical protein [Streptomyces sp. ME19-01-6]MDX3225180.1 hypothetical protein [Streptomyces sp. ME19-01-6]